MCYLLNELLSSKRVSFIEQEHEIVLCNLSYLEKKIFEISDFDKSNNTGNSPLSSKRGAKDIGINKDL